MMWHRANQQHFFLLCSLSFFVLFRLKLLDRSMLGNSSLLPPGMNPEARAGLTRFRKLPLVWYFLNIILAAFSKSLEYLYGYLFDVLASLGTDLDKVSPSDLSEKFHGFFLGNLPHFLQIQLAAHQKEEGLLVCIFLDFSHPALQGVEAINPTSLHSATCRWSKPGRLQQFPCKNS